MIDLINKAIELGWHLEIKEIKDNFIMLRTLNDEVKQFEASNIASYQIKAIVDGKSIIINSDDIRDTDKIIKTIQENYELLDNTDQDFLARESIVDESSDRSMLDINELRNDLLDLYEYKKKIPNIVNIDSILDSNIKITNIINSNNIELMQSTNFNCVYISVSVKDGYSVSEASDYYLFNKYNKEELIILFENVLKDAINRLEETTVKADKYNIIINNNAMYSILKSFKDMFFAKNINKGLSILGDSFEKQVFSEKVSIVEEPLNDNLKGTYKVLFDSEGTRCQNKVIIKEGKFINKLYDNKESIKEMKVSTGNSDGVNNMYIVPGNDSFNDLVKRLDNGIIITDLSGLHSGINTITGDMSLEAKGYLVKKGEIKDALNSILLSANIYEVFNNVLSIGSDLKFGSTHVGSPSILLENIMIVGEK